jgi:hypothetical protein
MNRPVVTLANLRRRPNSTSRIFDKIRIDFGRIILETKVWIFQIKQM